MRFLLFNLSVVAALAYLFDAQDDGALRRGTMQAIEARLSPPAEPETAAATSASAPAPAPDPIPEPILDLARPAAAPEPVPSATLQPGTIRSEDGPPAADAPAAGPPRTLAPSLAGTAVTVDPRPARPPQEPAGPTLGPAVDPAREVPPATSAVRIRSAGERREELNRIAREMEDLFARTAGTR